MKFWTRIFAATALLTLPAIAAPYPHSLAGTWDTKGGTARIRHSPKSERVAITLVSGLPTGGYITRNYDGIVVANGSGKGFTMYAVSDDRGGYPLNGERCIIIRSHISGTGAISTEYGFRTLDMSRCEMITEITCNDGRHQLSISCAGTWFQG